MMCVHVRIAISGLTDGSGFITDRKQQKKTQRREKIKRKTETKTIDIFKLGLIFLLFRAFCFLPHFILTTKFFCIIILSTSRSGGIGIHAVFRRLCPKDLQVRVLSPAPEYRIIQINRGGWRNWYTRNVEVVVG